MVDVEVDGREIVYFVVAADRGGCGTEAVLMAHEDFYTAPDRRVVGDVTEYVE